MTPPFESVICGISVRCDRPLPASDRSANGSIVTVVKGRSPRPHVPPGEGDDWPSVVVRGEAVLLRYRNDILFQISATDASLHYWASEALDDETFAHLLVDAALPQALAMFGHRVLHAGAVAGPAGAVLLLGESGAGKSTLVGFLAGQGYELLGDDVALLRTDDSGVFVVEPASDRLRLLPDSARLIDRDSTGIEMAYWSQKRVIDPRAIGFQTSSVPRPLAAIVELVEGGTAAQLEAVGPAHSLRALARHAFVSPESHLGIADVLDRWEPVAVRLPAYELRRPKTFDALRLAAQRLADVLDAPHPEY